MDENANFSGRLSTVNTGTESNNDNFSVEILQSSNFTSLASSNGLGIAPRVDPIKLSTSKLSEQQFGNVTLSILENRIKFKHGWNLHQPTHDLHERIFRAYKNHHLQSSLINFIKFRLLHFKARFYKELILISRSLMKDEFYIDSKKYHYLTHRYNAIDSERAIEVPWTIDILKKTKGDVLEVGNVISHYISSDHEVLDKYEVGSKIINEDAVIYDTDNRYDLIISISTLEHIGYDEEKEEREKYRDAIYNLLRLLKPDGKMIITLPIGYNPEVDYDLKAETIEYKKLHYMKRVSRLNTWKETGKEDALCIKYGQKYPAANAVAFIELVKN